MENTVIAASPLDIPVRAQFEHWMSDEGSTPKAVERRGDGYMLLQAQICWTAWQAAAKAEREACAKTCEKYGASLNNEWNQSLGVADDLVETCEECAEAIRARSNA
jgi:hypothetical protein